MLQLKNIRKAYATPAFTQVALDNVSLSFRDNEFAAILGPSGSGKTTLLNILGGLDHADSGEIVINGVSTKNYSSRDWDTYRNHRIGFIFQSYNLIAHQTVLSNVELALTLAGASAAERKVRAMEALERVGLAEHATKRPNQLSGGQMQRVAIARALVNDPDIVLADEPTGALDTETGLQVMGLLEEIASDRLVVMVTHNPELAEQYATRIIRLQDGKITDDTNPLELGGSGAVRQSSSIVSPLPVGDDGNARAARRTQRRRAQNKKRRRSASRQSDTSRHASMSFLTALLLSFNNLMTKKGRTFMTAFAGSIGIIGIAAILALSNGVNDYIARTEEEALSSYPLTITKSSFDMTNLMLAGMDLREDKAIGDEGDRVIYQSSIMGDMFAKVKNNDLRAFKAFLESGDSGIEPYVNSIQYSYGLNPLIYKGDTSEGVVKLNPSRMGSTLANGLAGSAFLGGQSMSSFTELLNEQRLLDQTLELVDGRWPQAYDECVFVLGQNGGVTDYTLYSVGFYDIKVMDDMLTKALSGEEVIAPQTKREFTIDDAYSLRFAVVAPPLLYQKNVEQGTWTDMTGDKAYMRRMLADEAVDLHVVGIVKQQGNASTTGVTEGIAYTPALTKYLMEQSQQSQIVKEQRAKPDVDVFTGKTFEELQDEESRSLDMESVFSIDEDALREAFAFDMSSLEGLGQNMDLSGLDLGTALSGMDLSNMDLSNLELDMSSLASVFDEERMRQIMQNAPQFTGEGLDLSSVSLELSDEQMQRLGQAAGDLVSDFVSWLVQSGALDGGEGLPDLGALVEQYLQTESAQQILASVMEELSAQVGPETAQRAGQMLRDYLTESLVPYLTEALQNVDVSQLDEEALRQILAGMPSLDVSALSELIGEEALSQIASQTASALAADFSSWLLQHPELITGDTEEGSGFEKIVSEYLQTDSAQKITSSLLGELGGSLGDGIAQTIGDAMASYMANQFAPYIAQQFETMFAGMAQNLGKQLGTALAQQIAAQMNALMGTMGSAISSQLSAQMGQLADAMQGGLSVDADAFARAIQFNMTQEDLTSLLTNYMNADELTYEANLLTLGFAEEDNPESISIYPIDFPAKESVLEIVDHYNERMEAANKEDAVIQYSDIAGVLMSSVTDIVNTISLVLIAFVSISLVVSSIMISIITYISVLERKKEIGILRAMGASKLNVANIFNAETVIEGFFAGVLAIAVVYAASVPVNEIVYRLKDVPNIMQLKPDNAAALVAVSVVLTLVAGLIPSSAAARRDPVEALRSE